MGTPLKNLVDARAVERLAAQLCAAHPRFPAQSFVDAAVDGLPGLELKARVNHVAEALRAALPRHWPDALQVLLNGMGPALPDTDAVAQHMHLWPVLQVVERHGLQSPERSLEALAALTQRFTAEFAVRPYITHHPDVAWPTLMAWTQHPSVHVRRLASEGCRPRLPWGGHLRGTVSQGLSVISQLRDDPERYVQRSVANHLNDISREDRALALQTAQLWAVQPSPACRWVLRHGLRTCIKDGDQTALALLGFTDPAVTVQPMALSTNRPHIGEEIVFSTEIRSKKDQDLMVDVVVEFRRVGGTRRKVFKGGVRSLPAGDVWSWSHRLPLRNLSTRTLWPGRHTVTLQINGRSMGSAQFDLQAQGAVD